MKKNIFVRLLFLLCAGFIMFSSPLRSKDGRFVDTIEDNFEEDMLLGSYLDETPFDNSSTRATIPAFDIITLIKDAGGFTVLDEELYLRTNPFVKRSILDLPLWEMHSYQEPEQWICGGQLFWNYMNRSVFTCKSSNINSYLDLDKITLFSKLDTISAKIKESIPDAGQISDLLDSTMFGKTLKLFSNFTVEQRRIGIMLHAWRQWKRAEVRMLWPFYYIERNHFATPSEKAAIENDFGAFTPDEFKSFSKNHGASDKLGFGDFRFEADYAAFRSDTFALRIGGFLTLPIAFTVIKDINGSSFSNNLAQPTFSLQDAFDIIFKDGDLTNPTVSANEQEAMRLLLIGNICKNKNGFLLGALDRLNAILLDTELGNHRHLGLGFIMRSRTSLRALLDEFEWSDNISWNNRLSVEYLTPANETRFYARRIPAKSFDDLDTESTDPAVQEATVAFLDKALVDKFYPYAIKTQVHPGVIFRWFSRWCITGEIWDITIGSDFWLQRDETLKNLNCVDSDLLPELDIKHAKKGMAYQFKSVAGLGLKFIRPDYALFFSINAEGTSWNKGIGDDWAVSLNLEANF